MWILLLLAGFLAIGLQPAEAGTKHRLLLALVLLVVAYRAVTRHLL